MKKLSTLELVLCALFTALIAVGAFAQVPVPGMDYFTLQFFFVLMAGMLLGSKLGAISTAVYVLIGLLGVPVFAAGGGIGYVFRPSFGYLIGFIVTAFVTGLLREKLPVKGVAKYFIAAAGGFIVCYAIGLTYKYFMLNFYVGEATSIILVLMDCFPLDMPGDILLSIIASLCAVRLQPAMRQVFDDQIAKREKKKAKAAVKTAESKEK